MNRSAADVGPQRLRATVAATHVGIWVAVLASVLICAIIAWLHFQQRDTFQRATAKVDSLRQSRIDLAQAFLHVTLAGGAASPFERAAGLASLRQAIDSIERTEAAAHSEESLQAFRRNAAAFRKRLQEWSNNPTYAQHADLLSAFHRLEQEADRIDADTRAQLHALLHQQRVVFVVALGVAALLLAGLCAAVLLAGRGRAISQAQTRRAEQGWREADQALQRSEARFRDTFEHAAVGIAHIALEGRFLRVNRKLCDILGYSRKELEAKSFQEVTHAQDVAADLALGARAQAGEIESYSGDKRYLRKDGGVVWVYRTATLVRNADGSPGYYLTVIEDIQKRKDMEAALRGNEERLRLALRAANQGLFEVDLRTRKAILSAEHLQMLGYDAQQKHALYEEIRARRHPDDVERLDRMYDEYANGTRTSHREELRLANRSGEWIWVLSFGQVAEWDEHGTPVRVLGTSTDITERKQTEAALRNSERRFRALIEQSSDSICVIDADNKILYLSPSVAAVEGYTPEELINRSGIDNTHPDDLPLVGRIVEQLLANPGKPVPVLWRRRHKDGRWIWLEGFATNLLDDPAVGGIVTNYHDVTERKLTEAALVSERTLMRTLIDALPDIVFTKDMAGRFVLCNAASVRHLGYSREEELTGKTVFDLFPEELAQIYHADDMRTLEGDAILNREEPSINAAREPRWFLTIKVPLRDPAGKITGLVGMSRDVTDRKRAEDLVRRTQKMEALGTLAGGIAHDFNNILLAITGNTRLAVADLPSEHPAQESLAEITKAGVRAAELVRRILAFSRPQETKRDTLQLRPAVEEALKLLRSTLPAMIGIRSSFAPDAPSVSADAGQIHQIIMNLTTNAAHAIGDRVGVIEIGVDAMTVSPDLAALSPDLHHGAYTRLTVSDNGSGMDKATLDRIFDPFFTTKPAGQGTGLGLSVVHGIMRAYDGAVTVYSQPGKGTTFHCYFPAAHVTVASVPTERRAIQSARGERVLYVDDESALVHLATRTLERLGYHVTGYHDPAQALQDFRERPDAFDVVITDLSMPGMSGFELAREVLAVRADIPLLLTSGYVRAQDEETARKMGVHSVILKPNTIEELGHTLDELFRAQ